MASENIKKPGSLGSGKGIVRVLYNNYEDKQVLDYLTQLLNVKNFRVGHLD
jgi:hypothetical protein